MHLDPAAGLWGSRVVCMPGEAILEGQELLLTACVEDETAIPNGRHIEFEWLWALAT